ncbi:MAG: formylglycine-generating enzyme family protein [Rhodocyclaceae bacterium]|nr:formylglycine-generating enzyme family protein [Rhodocyclaceae bacterium]
MAAGVRATVLCPAPAERYEPVLQTLFDVVPWDESVGRLRASQRGEARVLPSRKAAVANLLALASPCIQVEPALLRALRHLLPATEADAGIEADVWLHPDVEGDILWYWLSNPEAIARYQAEFGRLYRERPDWVRKAVLLIGAYHACLPDSMRLSELQRCEQLAPGVLNEKARQEVDKWCANMALTLRESGPSLPALKSWAGRELARNTPATLPDNPLAAPLFACIHAEALMRGERVELPDGLNVSALHVSLNRAGPVYSGSLVQVGNELRLMGGALSALVSKPFLGALVGAGEMLALAVTSEGKNERNVISVSAGLPATLCRLDRHTESVEIVSALERVRIEGIRKPDWAVSMRQDAEGLSAMLSDGTKAYWREMEGDLPAGWDIGGWRNPGNIGRDQYGLYAEFGVAGVTQRCRWIPAGIFLMGSRIGEVDSNINESPQHKVKLSGYWLADTACTQALWRAVMSDNPSSFKRNSNHPVDQVCWYDCREFFTRLNVLVRGLAAGIPYEAQWEHACRAGTTTAYSFGQTFDHKLANIGGQTIPVASLPPNPWGLYEMHGNVWEWCADWFGPYEAEPQPDPEGPPQGFDRVLRGGFLLFLDAQYVRSASRFGLDPGLSYRSSGLRVAPGQAGQIQVLMELKNESSEWFRSRISLSNYKARRRAAKAVAEASHDPDLNVQSWSLRRSILEKNKKKPKK